MWSDVCSIKDNTLSVCKLSKSIEVLCAQKPPVSECHYIELNGLKQGLETRDPWKEFKASVNWDGEKYSNNTTFN